MNSREALELEIRQLEAQLKPRKAALAALKRLEIVPQGGPSHTTRFSSMRPLDAIRDVLKERSKPIPKTELRQMLLDGGITIGKKRKMFNVDVGLRLAVKGGALTTTGEEELIGLPEWARRK
jgi:hypothetical protein